MRVVIIGAGGTKGTVRDCPTVEGFGKALARRHPSWRKEYTVLAQAVADLWPEQHRASDDWSLQDLWERLDYYAKLHPALSRPGYGGQASRELRKVILDVYGRCLIDRVSDLLSKGEGFVIRDILGELGPGDTLISFNWDLIAEYVLSDLGHKLVQVPHHDTRESVCLVKPHGSLSWPHVKRQGVQFQHPCGRPLMDPMMACELEHGKPEPFVLGAIPIKSELIRTLQETLGTDAYSVVINQWREVVEAIRKARDIVVVGYSFPEGDHYGRFLFREAVSMRSCGRIEHVSFYEKSDYQIRQRMCHVLQSVFHPTVPPEWKGEVASSDTRCGS